MKWKKRNGMKMMVENIKCQVTLIFTLYFLHKTANPRLVFRLIQIFLSFFFIFFYLFLFIFNFFFEIERNKD